MSPGSAFWSAKRTTYWRPEGRIARGNSTRVANSLQIIASIILLKGRRWIRKRRAFICKTLTSGSCRLRPYSNTSMASAASGSVEWGLISQGCCEAIATSMIGENRPISLKVSGEGGVRLPVRPRARIDRHRIVINSLKHAFSENTKEGRSPLRMLFRNRLEAFDR